MEVRPIFSIGIGKAKEPELLGVARQLFKDNQEAFVVSKNELRTTLRTYNSVQDAAALNNTEAVDALKKVITKNAIAFYSKIGFDTDSLEFIVANLWLNEMESGSAHETHSHYGFQLSGCFYVDVPPGSDLIKFYSPIVKREHGNNPYNTYNEYNAEYFGAMPEEGDMYFWESLQIHQVPPLEFEGVRRSIAYDLKISRKLESKKIVDNSLDHYVAVYNINNPTLCKTIVSNFEDNEWKKHAYNDVITNTNLSYEDDLEIAYQNNETTNMVQSFVEKCVFDYVKNVPLVPFAIQNATPIRFNRYVVGTNMKVHVDHIHSIFDGPRKGVPILTILGLLNDDFEGGALIMFGDREVKLTIGDVIVFPSNFLYPHEVTTVTKGVRFSFVSWAY
jgi:uncharacterized protein (TIGR02466 family)